MDAQRLSELYRAVVMEHHRHPRGQGAPATFSAQAYGKNPVCGDEVTIYLSPCPQGGWETRWTGESKKRAAGPCKTLDKWLGPCDWLALQADGRRLYVMTEEMFHAITKEH